MKNQFCLLTSLGLVLSCFSLPVAAKSVWLECGKDRFYLDEEKREYSTTRNNEVIQGSAVFFPSQIDFSVPLATFGNDGSGIRYDYSINRKTLEYQKKVMSRRVMSLSFAYSDTGWVQQKGDHSLTVGTCKVIKNPTEGNKI
jgi:hypothetical protein